MHPHRRLGLAVSLVTSMLLACGGDPPAGDPDGGPVEMDAARADAGGGGMDSGPARTDCEGFPQSCSSQTAETCAGVMGCRMSNCGGAPVACSSYLTSSECGAAAGCAWAGDRCEGDATPCEQLDTMEACGAQQGCFYTTDATCRGTPVRCEGLDLATCESQPGCRARIDAGPPGRDAQLPDTGPPLWDGGGICNEPEASPTGGCNPETGIECDGDWRGINPRTGSEFCASCAADRCCTPRGGTFQCVDRDAEGRCPAPDLFPDADRIRDRYTIEYREFSETSCALVEGCVTGPGMRRLLRFDTWTPNVGTADMFLGVPSASSPYYEYSSCHRHYHFNSYAEYELLTPDGMCVAATGHKQAFCLLDFYHYPGTSGAGAVYNCGYQGIQQNWQDVYSSALDCQWIDITDVPEGTYLLRVRINTEHVLNETNYDNNEILVPVTITPEPGPPAVMIDSACATPTDGGTRDCGWTRAYDGTCTAGADVTVGCSDACGLGSCTGDTVVRVCETALGNNCSALLALGSNDASGCGTGSCSGEDCCSQVTFTCPGTGTYTVWSAPFSSGDAATCTVAVAP